MVPQFKREIGEIKCKEVSELTYLEQKNKNKNKQMLMLGHEGEASARSWLEREGECGNGRLTTQPEKEMELGWGVTTKNQIVVGLKEALV